MQPKNLVWKFAFVALVALMASYVFAVKPLREGVDLRGGYVLTFRVRTFEREREEVQAQIAALDKKIEAAQGESKDALTAQKAALEEKLKGLPEGRSADLIERVIARLKERIDPAGLRSLEWVPMGEDRFEVRMPVGSPEAQKAKEAYLSAMDEMEKANVRERDIRTILQTPPDRRDARIDELAAGDDGLKQTFQRVAQAHEKLQADTAKLQQAIAAGAAPDAVQAAQEQQWASRYEYETVLKDIDAFNVNTERLGQTLALFVTKTEADTLPKAQLEERRRDYAARLNDLRQRFPARGKMIDKVVNAYETWAGLRSGLDDPADLKRLVAKAGVLEFRIAPVLPGSSREPKLATAEYAARRKELEEFGPLPARNRNDQYQWFPVRKKTEQFQQDLIFAEHAGKKYILLCNDPDMTMLRGQGRDAWSLRLAYPDQDQNGRRAVGFQMDPRGASRFGVLTGKNKGKNMAILLDDEVYSAPTIQAVISQRGIIRTGDFTPREIGELVNVLNAGTLEGQVDEDPVSEKAIAPTMGRAHREAGLGAVKWGLVGVALFMLAYYLGAGLIADVALVLNLLLIVGAMSFSEAIFTLPGIAGLILTIGMAVDANVLIFERLREEQAKTQSMRVAIRNAYANATSAILDSNVTTLLTCLILGWVGTTEIRGFAITLSLGVMFSLFTSLVVTRWIFQALVEIGLIKGRIGMLTLIGRPKVNWMAKRRLFWVLSLVVMVAGMAALAHQGTDVLDLEFSSGVKAAFSFQTGAAIPDDAGRPVAPNRDNVEAALIASAQKMNDQAPSPELQQFVETSRVVTTLTRDKAGPVLARFDKAPEDGKISLAEWADGKGAETLFKAADANNDGFLQSDEINAGMPEWTYDISAKVADVELVRGIVENAFDRKLLDMRSSIRFKLEQSGRAPVIGAPLSEADAGKTRITPELIQAIDPNEAGSFLDFVGGVMFVVRDLDPPLSEQEMVERIKTMRSQPDFSSIQFNRSSVIPLESATGGDAFTSFAVLARNPNADYTSRPLEWQSFADGEWDLVNQAMEREESLESVAEFGPQLALKAGQSAVIAFVLSWLAIIVYLWVRFGSARWGLAAVACLIHDVIIAVGMVALAGVFYDSVLGRLLGLEQFKIDPFMVAAFLTIIGYSVNDTIVVFDRIRENRGKLTTVDENTINRSINQTLGRTLLTTATTLIAVVIMYVMGGSGIHGFTFALLVGIIFGTYSSIAIASPLLLGLKHALVGRIVPDAAPAK